MYLIKYAAIFVFGLACAWGAAFRTLALEPEEVAVLYAEGNDESKDLALHYAKARGIPERDNVFSVEVPPGNELDRSAWEEKVKPAILDWLEQNDPNRKLRCIVTCRGIPLKIGKRDSSSPPVIARSRFLRESRRRRVAMANELVKRYAEMIGREVTRSPDLVSTATSKQVADRLEGVISFTQQYIKALPTTSEKQKVLSAYERFLTAAGGIDSAAKMISGRVTQETVKNIPPQQAIQIGVIAGRAQGLTEALTALNALPDTVARDVQLLNLTERTKGIVGTIMWIDEEQGRLRENETASSFDSELSLVYWPDYQLFGSSPNLLYYLYETAGVDKSREMMVSRLTAPTLETAKAMVDSAVAAEREGLKGKVYLDARGISDGAQNEEDGPYYGSFDQSLRDLAARIKATGRIEVVLDNQETLFAEGGCSDVALYCGWLGEQGYVDAFTWVPGAIGYHLAKDGASSVQKPGGTAWCNGMIEKGVAGTLGPVYPTKLEAFPLPDLFFSTLLTGEYTLVEAYYRTKPYNSGMMVLIGDPLYNPFKEKPVLGEDDMPDLFDPEKRQQAAQQAAAAQAAGQQGQPSTVPSSPESKSGSPGVPSIEGTDDSSPGTEKKEEKKEEFKFSLPGLDSEDEKDGDKGNP